MGKASRHKQERHNRLGINRPEWNQATRHYGGEKISASLVELVDPYVDDETTLDELRFLVAAGAIAWNLANATEPERLQKLEESAASLDDDGRQLFESLIQELIDRKLDMFPYDARIITGWDVRKKNGQPYIAVAAAIDMPMMGAR